MNRLGAIVRLLRLKSGWAHLLIRFHALNLSESGILLTFAVAIGLVGALGVVAFYRLIDVSYEVFFGWTGSVLGSGVGAVYRPLITAIGMTGAWALVRRLKGERGAENVAAIQLAVARRHGDIRARPASVRTLAAAVTMGSGGSVGSEGPVAVLGATVGSVLGRAFRFDSSRVKVLVGAGAAAGISASFNAPLAGAFFALEEIAGTRGGVSFPPVVVSSVVAAIVSRSVFGDHPAFPIPMEYGFTLRREVFLFYPVLGIVAGLVAALFIRVFFLTATIANQIKTAPIFTPIVGGLAVGLIVWLSQGLLVGTGHLALRTDLFGGMALSALLLLVLGKILVTSISLGFGGVGGVFTPSLYIGAGTGGAFGLVLSALFPELNLRPEAYALVGMGSVVAAATAAPITAILIVFEMTNDYAIVVPLMVSAVVAQLVARRVEPDSLYSGWLRRRGEHLSQGEDQDILTRLTVQQALDPDPTVIMESADIDQLLDHLGRTHVTDFPVVDADHQLLGVISVAELGRIARDASALASVVIAADIAGPTEVARPTDSLLEAIRKMGVRGGDSIPVVDPESGRLVGTIGRAQILALYERAVADAEIRSSLHSHGLGAGDPSRPAA